MSLSRTYATDGTLEVMHRYTVCAGIAALFFGSLLSASPAHAFVTSAEVKEAVVSSFADTPEMIAIAECESKFRQYRRNGRVLYGGYGGGMVGVYQIYEAIHAPMAAALGHNLTTLEGNLGYAKHLYEEENTTPWNASSHCWSEKVKKYIDLKPEENDEPDGVQSQTLELTTEEHAAMLDRIKKLRELIVTLQTLLAQRELARAENAPNIHQ